MRGTLYIIQHPDHGLMQSDHPKNQLFDQKLKHVRIFPTRKNARDELKWMRSCSPIWKKQIKGCKVLLMLCRVYIP